MHADVTITDPDRNLDFTLGLEFSFRGGSRARLGWNDGGEAGEPPAIEIDRVRCLEVIVWCGKRGISAVPGLAVEDRLESGLGDWCLEHYADEIERAVWKHLRSRRTPALCHPADR